MTARTPQCPRCGIAMDEGFLVDRGHANSVKPAQWVDGAPEPSFWTGTKTRHKERYRVATFRCDRCGYLESYATTAP